LSFSDIESCRWVKEQTRKKVNLAPERITEAVDTVVGRYGMQPLSCKGVVGRRRVGTYVPIRVVPRKL